MSAVSRNHQENRICRNRNRLCCDREGLSRAQNYRSTGCFPDACPLRSFRPLGSTRSRGSGGSGGPRRPSASGGSRRPGSPYGSRRPVAPAGPAVGSSGGSLRSGSPGGSRGPQVQGSLWSRGPCGPRPAVLVVPRSRGPLCPRGPGVLAVLLSRGSADVRGSGGPLGPTLRFFRRHVAYRRPLTMAVVRAVWALPVYHTTHKA